VAQRDLARDPLSVLIVDDDAVFGESLRMFLDGDERLRVDAVATDLVGALRAARETQFDLALVDVRLMQEDGFAVAEALRALDPAIVAVMMSGLDVADYEERAVKAGARALLQKTDIVRRGRDAIVSACLSYATPRS
jgi:two-component system NarL family response regulator